jgi:hypothetical protein
MAAVVATRRFGTEREQLIGAERLGVVLELGVQYFRYEIAATEDRRRSTALP